MASRELSLFADLDQGRLVQGFSSTLQAVLPRFVFGDSVPVSFRALKENDGNSGDPWAEVDLTGKTVRLAIGNPAGTPTSGTFTLTYGANTTTAISYAADGAAIQAALNALASITSAGGVVVTKGTGGAFRIVFNSAGARTAITADTAALYPSSGADIRVAVDGDVSTREIVVARLETLPAAYAELTDEFPAASADISVVRAGVNGVESVAAECVLVLATGTVADDSFSIGAVTFTFKVSPSGDEEIEIGDDDAETLANIKAKLNAHPGLEVTAEDRSESTLLLVCKQEGTEGNEIEVDNISSAVSFTDEDAEVVTALYGGVDLVTAVGEIQSLEFPAIPYAGIYTLAGAGYHTLGIPWNADASTLQAALEAAYGSGMISVTGALPSFAINFDASLGNVATLTADVSALVVPTGRSGLLDTNTAGVLELLDGSAQADAKLEIELLDDGDGTAWTILQTECTVIDDVIANSPFSVTGGPRYATLEGDGTLIVVEMRIAPREGETSSSFTLNNDEGGGFTLTAGPDFDDGLYAYNAPTASGYLCLTGNSDGRSSLGAFTVATLPDPTIEGDIAYVTDALTPVFLSAVVGGGTVKCPVFYDGTLWKVG